LTRPTDPANSGARDRNVDLFDVLASPIPICGIQ
jgi:hypothetical protein